ncbi:DUF4429 domain-containing protein [Streptomyces scabiei]|uniref:DUF4429 domain-containing protein n=1 Tax=Streptomyces scabiei TaxID=1930 RepID=UPI001B306E93|nr:MULTISPECIES: DUF4429 domain-containing protein [Streptomyces]MBP5863981.1 DUF4429 domain-containing protein [Streptomyces sp. LBUM 1484]MBP5875393.1 DUF4429 domain-containing protein [Streptomyces sp. LBUM 1477]MBP5883214.1 DUF4429 domain-containing protein [Streptomyces sp. LBUM 1487]MBP5893966.1 DUF4429 domain-containing protein [Streptomyces sp. LBUM 1481]MBP5899237.1 DUF4429 domain-containing protein [Streptomyces sp. LBUM 1488]
MGDVLAGLHAVWEFESDSVLIRFERGIRTPKLFQALGERRIPLEAIAEVTLTPGKRGTVVLHAVPRQGADPLMEAAAGQLKEGSDPYRLVLPAERETLAEYYADELRARLTGSGPADRFLVAAPEVPLQFKAYDGKASFDGRSVSFRWFWTGASSAKWKAGDQSFPVSALSGVEWRSPELFEGYLRLLRRDANGEQPAQPDHDPAAVVFGLGYGPVHESLPFAAAVLAAARTGSAGPVEPATAAAPRRDPADIADRIRHLGELHEAGLVTDEEFSVKKAELLAEL